MASKSQVVTTQPYSFRREIFIISYHNRFTTLGTTLLGGFTGADRAKLRISPIYVTFPATGTFRILFTITHEAVEPTSAQYIDVPSETMAHVPLLSPMLHCPRVNNAVGH